MWFQKKTIFKILWIFKNFPKKVLRSGWNNGVGHVTVDTHFFFFWSIDSWGFQSLKHHKYWNKLVDYLQHTQIVYNSNNTFIFTIIFKKMKLMDKRMLWMIIFLIGICRQCVKKIPAPVTLKKEVSSINNFQKVLWSWW